MPTQDDSVFTFLTITMSDPLYQRERELRKLVLLDPIGVPGWWHKDEDSVHVVVTGNGALVGCVLVHKPTGQVLQMCVHPDYNRRGLGRKLMQRAEREAAALGHATVFLHARASVVPFYERLGFAVEGEPFEEVGLSHCIMRKQVDAAAARSERAAQLAASLRFRLATEADVPEVTSLINGAYEVERFLKLHGTRTNEEEVRSLLAAPQNDFICAVAPSGALCGCLIYSEVDDNDAYLGMLSVSSEAKGVGLGAQLVRQAEQRALEQGKRRMKLCTVSCRPELMTYYGRMGYEVYGTEEWPGDKHKVLTPEFVDTFFYHMQRELRPAAASTVGATAAAGATDAPAAAARAAGVTGEPDAAKAATSAPPSEAAKGAESPAPAEAGLSAADKV